MGFIVLQQAGDVTVEETSSRDAPVTRRLALMAYVKALNAENTRLKAEIRRNGRLRRQATALSQEFRRTIEKPPSHGASKK